MKKLFLFSFLLLIAALNVFSQQAKVVSGIVSGPDGPLAGVSVSAKLAGNTVATNEKGKYVITAGFADTLLISAVGYTPMQIPVGNREVIDVDLSTHSLSLDDVVVIGYGKQSKRNVTGAVSKVDMKQTENLPNTNVTQALRGRVAGVQFTDNTRPGQNGSILIRGPRSLSGGNNPLIVVDGIIFNGSLSDINPNDIESMEILKDASASAIYGSRAANGVILITSKKGNTEKPNIQLNTFYGLSDWSHRVKLLSPDRYIEKTLEMRRVLGLDADPSKIASYLAVSEAANYEAGKTTDPWDAISQQGKINSLDLSLSGNTNLTNYYLSGSITNENGLIYNDDQKSLSFRANIENKVNKWLTVGLNASFSRRNVSGLEASISQAAVASPYGTYYYDDGLPTQYVVPEDQNSGNPMRSALLTKNEEVYNNLFTNFYGIVKVPFIEGLSYRMNYSPNIRWDHNYNFFQQDPHLSVNTTNASKFNRSNYDWVLENILTYNRQINSDNAIDLTLLYGRNHLEVESTTANASQLSSPFLGWNNLGLGNILTNTSNASGSDGVSYMFRSNYRLKNKYLFTFTVRRDGSSVFAAENKYATFPSGAVAWIVSDETFMKKVQPINMLKIRLSYGAIGNQAISPYQSLSLSGTTRYVFGDGGTSSVGIYQSTMANPSLKWETTYSTNVGIDFEIFKSRISGTIELYSMNTRNLLVRRSLPTMTGYNSVWTNLGRIGNKGFELTLNTLNIKNEKFVWGSTLLFSANSNKIVHLYGSDTNGDGEEDDDLSNKWFIGHPINVAFDYVLDGIYQEGDKLPAGYKPGFVRLKDLNGDGIINAEDRAIIGQTGEPKYRWGLGNNFSYGPISLSIFINAMEGWIEEFRKKDPNSNFGANYPARALNQFDLEWWTPENKSNTSPSLAYNNPYQHSYYFNRDFIRIQDVSLSYNFPNKVINKIKVADLRLILSGKNLFTFTKWPGSDPESGGTISFPMPRTVSAGLNVRF